MNSFFYMFMKFRELITSEKYNTHNSNIDQRIEKMILNLENLEKEVSRVSDVQKSAVVLLKNLTKELEAISIKLVNISSLPPPEIDVAPLNNLIEKLKVSTDALSVAVSDASSVVPIKEIILNADDPTKPTVSVTLPQVLPENVAINAETLVEIVDTNSSEPQVSIVVESASKDPSDENTVSDMIETPEGQVNVNIEVPVEVFDIIKHEADVDVIQTFKDAVIEAEVPAVEAEVPVTEETQPQ